MAKAKKRTREESDAAERIELASARVRFQELNETLGKPVDTRELWEAFAELRAAYLDAAEDIGDELREARSDLEYAEAERKAEEKRADDAEEENGKLEIRVADLEMEVDRLKEQLEN
jgi:chromosome segregation ATPase